MRVEDCALSQIDPQELFDVIRTRARPLAQAKANRVYMEGWLKTLKARLMKSCGENSAVAQEREAYASEEYAQALANLREATEQEEELRWKMVAAQAGIEIWRSLEASNRNIDRAAR